MVEDTVEGSASEFLDIGVLHDLTENSPVKANFSSNQDFSKHRNIGRLRKLNFKNQFRDQSCCTGEAGYKT